MTPRCRSSRVRPTIYRMSRASSPAHSRCSRLERQKMSRALRLQDPGEGLHEAEIVEINVAVGDRVEEGETVLAAETD
ncbi:MAG: biotin/lipoyl-containing protein, partial [Halochromatium sp.]